MRPTFQRSLEGPFAVPWEPERKFEIKLTVLERSVRSALTLCSLLFLLSLCWKQEEEKLCMQVGLFFWREGGVGGPVKKLRVLVRSL